MKISVRELAGALGAEVVGNPDLQISGPAEPATATADQIALAMQPAYTEALGKGKARVAILWNGADWRALGLEAAIFVPRPRYALAGVNGIFGRAPEVDAGIHETALVADDAEIGEGAAIGPFVVIGRGVKIGPNARILSHSSIAEEAVIGANALLYNGVRIGARVVIGDDFICHSNAAIGNDGFSFVSPEPGVVEEARAEMQVRTEHRDTEYVRINSLGTVIIGDRVEIGAGATLDRGTIADTVIGEGSKLDNMVHIGHNVRVGRNCLLCGQVGIAGSSTIGDGSVLAGQVGVADHVSVGENVVAAGQTGITSNVPPNRMIMGNPAVKMDTQVDMYKALRRLPRLAKKVAELEARLSKTDTND